MGRIPLRPKLVRKALNVMIRSKHFPLQCIRDRWDFDTEEGS